MIKSSFNYLYNQPYILLCLTTLFWAGNFVTSRTISAEFGAIPLAYIRWGIALIILTPFAIKYVKADWALIKKHWIILSLLSATGITIFNTFVYIGLRDTTAINALLIQSLGPIIVFLWSFILFRNKLRPTQMLAICISLLGVFYIVFKGQIGNIINLNFNIGDIYIIVAIIFYSLYSALLRNKPNIHWLSFLYMTFLLGEIMLTPFLIWDLLTVGNHMFLNIHSISVMAYVAIFPAIIAYICFNRAVALVGANVSASFFHLIPVFGTILAIIFINETLQTFHIIGFSLVITGIYIGSRKQNAITS
ncbi:MAG: DMT family transporter [Rhizobiales bacterium]|nr:DMT family transporter [Hyphomicrobiales bacterium]